MLRLRPSPPSFLGPLMLDVLRERRFAEAAEILRMTPSLGDLSRFNAIAQVR